MKVSKVVPMGYCSNKTMKVFLVHGDFGVVGHWLVGLVWLKCYVCTEKAVSKAWRTHDCSRSAYDL